MNKSVIGLVLCSLAVTACNGGEPAPASGQAAEETASSAQALDATLPVGMTGITYGGAVAIGTCIYQVGYGQAPETLPPQYWTFVHKFGFFAPCANPGYVVFKDANYAPPALSIAKAVNNEIAVSFIEKNTPSGAAKLHAEIRRLDTPDLIHPLSSVIAVPQTGLDSTTGYVHSANLVFTVPGDLIVSGTKSGIYPGEVGGVGGTNYQATFPGYATATTAPAPSLVLDW